MHFFIRINLPSYSRFNFPFHSPFDTEEVWPEIVRIVRQLRHEVATPIVVVPSLYCEDGILPVIDGIVRNSPAAQSELHPGDVVHMVNGERVFSRVQLRAMLYQSWREKLQAHLQVTRGQVRMDISLKRPPDQVDEDTYPYMADVYDFMAKRTPYGILTIDGFRISYLHYLEKLLVKYHPRCALLVVSKLVEPVFHQAVERFAPFALLHMALKNKRLQVVRPEKRILGGQCHPW